MYNNLDGNIRRLFYPDWTSEIKAVFVVLLFVIITMHTPGGMGSGTKMTEMIKPGNLFILYIYIFLQMIYTETESKRLGSGLWWPANTVQKHRNLICFSMHFASLFSLTHLVGEPFAVRRGAFVC